MEAQTPGDGQTEAKVQVDRRKLEAMIIGEAPGENADAFFGRVERNTGAKICWPSKLKIRAKTKKDPFVKLIGTPQNVQRAVEVIEEHLRVKKERVVLKIEVSHSLHSQIIGRGGRNTQQIMRDTNCHIHFPDSNKSLTNPPMTMNDQVSISGCAKDVETAREMIRAFCPVTVAVTIQLDASRNLYSIQPHLDPAQLQRHFPPGSDLSVQFVSQSPPLMGTLNFLMRSSSRNELEMLRAFGKVCQLIGIFPSGAELQFECQFELRPVALPSLGAVRWIAFRTNTQIHLNELGLLISGPLEGLFIARKLLTGLLPASLHFEKSSELSDPCTSMSAAMETELDVQIRERRRRKGTKAAREENPDERDFVVCTYEANLFGAYTARNRLLQIKGPTKDQFPQDSESTAFMRSVCRESLMADQQQPLIGAASIAFSNSATLSFGHKEMVGWKVEANQQESGVEEMTKCRHEELPKSPDPQKSPIAAGLLAGAKSVNSQKGEFREVMMLKANRAIYNSPLNGFGQRQSNSKELIPTDLWSGYGFSSSLPVDLLRLGRKGGSNWSAEVSGMGAEGQWRKGRPIVGRGTDDAKNGQNGDGSWRRKERRETSFGRSVDQPSAIPFSATQNGRPSNCSSSSTLLNSRNCPLVVLHEVAKESEEAKEEVEAVETVTIVGEAVDIVLNNANAPKVHPRVAALQMAEQKRIKFAMSTGGLFDASSRIPSANGFCTTTPAGSSDYGRREREEAAGGAQQSWDIRATGEPALVLAQLGLAEHIAFFREQEIDMQAFLLLDEQCLKSLGVATIGARRKILHAILKLRDSARLHGMYSL
uniref:SAM domain-containing protein n=1 Tax=Globodera rostochiensis TaxID=31243 RepID=A0A914HE08_GLORO